MELTYLELLLVGLTPVAFRLRELHHVAVGFDDSFVLIRNRRVGNCHDDTVAPDILKWQHKFKT